MPAPTVQVFGEITLHHSRGTEYYGALGANTFKLDTSGAPSNLLVTVSMYCQVCGELGFKQYKPSNPFKRVQTAMQTFECEACKFARQTDAEEQLGQQFRALLEEDALRCKRIANIMGTNPASSMHPRNLAATGLIITHHRASLGDAYAQHLTGGTQETPYRICKLVVTDKDNTKVDRLYKLLKTSIDRVDLIAHTTPIGTLPCVVLPPPLEPTWLHRHLTELRQHRRRIAAFDARRRKSA